MLLQAGMEAQAHDHLLRLGWRGARPARLHRVGGDHAAELQRKAAVYINSDCNGRGFLQVEGSHTLEKFINGVARDIEDPETKVIGVEAAAGDRASRATPTAPKLATRADLRIAALGSGSDYTAFLDHLGIASVNMGFGGEDQGGIYHSIYDDFYWYTHFSDKDFVYGRALAQTAGTTVMRLADADVLPLDFDNFTETLRRYIDEVQKLAREKRDQIVERNRQIDDGVFALIDDPRRPRTVPPREAVPPFLNFAPLENGFAALQRTARRLRRGAGARIREWRRCAGPGVAARGECAPDRHRTGA